MNVLIIWNEMPESILTQKVSMTEAEYEIFSKAHNKFLNENNSITVDNTINAIYFALNSKEEVKDLPMSEYIAHKYAGKWLHDKDSALISDISLADKLIITGIYL